eukprot:COSAG01_NODE_42704_length_437_cov_1.106509_1_plen_129_part_01
MRMCNTLFGTGGGRASVLYMNGRCASRVIRWLLILISRSGAVVVAAAKRLPSVDPLPAAGPITDLRRILRRASGTALRDVVPHLSHLEPAVNPPTVSALPVVRPDNNTFIFCFPLAMHGGFSNSPSAGL